jgi:hypothetical protein
MISRSMGHADLYPFVLAPAALNKMCLVHDLVTAAATAAQHTDTTGED